MIKKIRNKIGKRLNAFKVLYQEYNLLVSHFGSSDRTSSIEKEKALVLMELHTIEKGLSLKDIRIGFGQTKVKHVLKLVIEFNKNFNNSSLNSYVIPVIEEYISFHKLHNFDLDKIITEYFNEICSLPKDLRFHYSGGTREFSKMDILKHTNMDFEDFFSHRFSIRNYSGAKIDENLIRKALEISEKTPSQCNRQPWYNAVVSNKDLIDQLISLQQGGRQFKNDISHAVVVCGKYTHFYGSEHHQPFVSAGMYAMSLLLAFHSLGLGAIPLNLGIDIKRINKIQKLLDLPDGCFPVLIVGVGDINEEIKVAFAERFKYTEYTKFYI